MAHNRDVAIATLATDESDMTVSSDAYPGSDGRAVVDPFMRAPCLEYRVKSRVCESGSYARELDRGTQKGLAHVAAVRSVVAVAPLIVAKKYSPEYMTLIDEFGRKHAPEPYEFAIGSQCFIDYGESIAATQIAMEIDVAGENFRQLQGNHFRNTRGVRRRKQRGFNLPRTLHYPLLGLWPFLG